MNNKSDILQLQIQSPVCIAFCATDRIGFFSIKYLLRKRFPCSFLLFFAD